MSADVLPNQHIPGDGFSDIDGYGDIIDGKAHYRRLEDHRLTAEEMDEKRKENVAYEYLCHLEEAKMWIEACIGEKLCATVELEENLRNGVVLAKLGHFISPELVPLKKVYDKDLSRYQSRGLHFRHTDNINHWLRSLQEIDMPRIFYPETKKLTYTIARICRDLYLFKLGRAPQIQDLYGKIQFTDEEINAMRLALEKYGIQMPAFSKIGGILANEMPVDEAALHAAVIAINEAIDHDDPATTLHSLKIPEAHLTNLNEDMAEAYQTLLHDAKLEKAEVARNKSLDPDNSYIPDVYDELLTQAEIQGNINKVNILYALAMVNEMVERKDRAGLITSLAQQQLRLRDVNSSNADFYLARLLQLRENQKKEVDTEDMLSKEEIQSAIMLANEDADVTTQKKNAVHVVNKALDEEDSAGTFQALQNPKLNLPNLLPSAQLLYHEELKCMKAEKQSSLDLEEIESGICVLNAIAKVNQAIDTCNSNITFTALCNEYAHITNLDENCQGKYLKSLSKSKRAKQSNILTHYEIQSCIDDVNDKVADEHDRILAVNKINEAIDQNIPEKTHLALKTPSARLQNVDAQNTVLYQQLLGQVKQEKAQETKDPTAVLWYEEIQSAVNLANAQAEEGKQLSLCVAAINIAVDNDDERNLMNYLQSSSLRINGISRQCTSAYLEQLKAYKAEKEQAGEIGSGWMMNKLKEGFKYYFNIKTMESAWQQSPSIKKDYSLLTREEILSCISGVTADFDRQLLYKSNEKFIILLQAQIRGLLARQKYRSRMTYLKTRLPAVIKLQSWWRMMIDRHKYLERQAYYNAHRNSVIQIQSYIRMFLARKRFVDMLDYYKNHEGAAVKIQAFMRSAWAKQDYKALMHGENPAISVVRKFVHLLDINDHDYSEEIELEKLRQCVVTEIRSNKELELALSQMDIKIGLLVKNRITLQDVISQNKTLKQYHDASTGQGRGLKALSKQSHDRLEAYQHLFYLLQTNPTYLAKLIFEMPQSRTTKFMESAVLTLYNYASNQREEYLLLRLFKTALEEEIDSKVTGMSDIITGNPMVVKMIVSFNRNARGQGLLRELLNPLVRSVIDNKNLQINTNVVEVYKQWVNQMEAETGRPSGLPYEATTEQASQHEEVMKRIGCSVQALQDATERFLSAILSSIDKIPYGMRYMAKVMRNALRERFPNAAEKEILKIIGNLIYYRYINSAIVAPDAFDIIEVAVSNGLTNEQRRNLGSIAKILQFAASNKGFGNDSQHLVSMNKYIMDAHARFKKYFQTICDVEEPEVMFNMDQYSDVARVTKPIIYISIGEIIEMHKLLLDHQQVIAPDPADPLHELLDDLGEVHDVDVLMGDASLDEVSKAQLAKTEISLTLSNKFEVPDGDHADRTGLMLRTKQMVVDVIRCQKTGDSLVQVLKIPATEDEENVHVALIKARERSDQKLNKSKLLRQQSSVGDNRLPLESMKVQILENLRELETADLVSYSNGYQAVINSIVQDVRNQRLYRQRRKQEMVRLKCTLKSLGTKRAFFEEQINYYNQYVKTCLDKQAAKVRKSNKAAPEVSIKYSAARLHEKGILLEIEGLSQNQFKNVLFEISSTETSGRFDVNAKFMGVTMEKVELLFQNLLELQYEGTAVMKMFDKAQVNVNLLIFLLNKKFYGKK